LFPSTDYIGNGTFGDHFTDYTVLNAANLDDVEFCKRRITLINAGMGIGKTVALTKFIKSRPDKKFIIISNRVALTNEALSKMNESMETDKEKFVSYQDIDGPIYNFRRLIIQVESLHRLSTAKIAASRKGFTVILDESESLIKQFDSVNHRDKLEANKNTWDFLIRTAEYIIGMDATMTWMTPRVLLASRRNRGDESTIAMYRITTKTQNKTTFNVTSSRDNWLSKLISLAKEKRRIVIATNTKTVADSLHLAINDVCKHAKVGMYNSDTLASVKKKHFSNVNKYWKKYDILIYTPTAGAGISFEKKHYDYLFGYFVTGSCDAESCIQLLGRVRDIASGQAYLYIDPQKTTCDTTREAVLKSVLMYHEYNKGTNIPVKCLNDDGKPEIEITPKLEMDLWNIVTKNRSEENLFDRIVKILSIYSDNIEYYQCESDIKVYNFAYFIEQKKEEMAIKIAEAPIVTRKEVEIIEEKGRAFNDVDEMEKRSVEKFYLSSGYHVEPEAIDKAFVLRYDKETEKQQFKNLCMIPDIGDLVDSSVKMNSVLKANTVDTERNISNKITTKTLATEMMLSAYVVNLLQMIGVKSLKKKTDIDVEALTKNKKKISHLCYMIVQRCKITKHGLFTTYGSNVDDESFIEDFKKLIIIVMKIVFGIKVIKLSNNIDIRINERDHFAFQTNIEDRSKHPSMPKIMSLRAIYNRWVDDVYVKREDKREYDVKHIAAIEKAYTRYAHLCDKSC